MTEPQPTSERDVKEKGALVAGKYRIIKLLGRGGMGAVYEVEHVGVKRRFALKVMTRDVSEQKDAVRRFTQEAQAAARIGSPNIVDVFDLGEDNDGSLYMVMELLRGRTLHDVEEKMPIRRAVALTCELLSALSSAHEHGIVHRDVKPQNLFLAEKTGSSEPVLKVLDFGIAKFREQGDDGTVSDHTKSGVVVGTPLYMAPEQVMGDKEIDGRVDVWAAGATLFELLTGRSVHLAPNATAAAVRVVTEKAPRVDALRKDVEAALADIVEKSLAIERDDRFSSADEMKRALDAYLAGEARTSGERDVAGAAVENAREAVKDAGSQRPRGAQRSPMWLVGVAAFALGVGVVAVLATKTTTGTTATATATATAGTTTATATATTTSTATATATSTTTATATSTTTATATSTAATTSTSTSTSTSTMPSPSILPSSSSRPSPSSVRPPLAPPPRKPECVAGQVSSDGHCCPTGHVWESGRCARPVATSFP